MSKQEYAPVLLFVYKRLNTLRQTVAALQQNFLASKTDLFVFSDAAKTRNDELNVSQVRSFIQTIDGFKTVQIINAPSNLGLANSIINGVTQIIGQYGNVIVLEDDLVTSINFLSFVNQCLYNYKEDKQVLSIAGYSPTIKNTNGKDIYFTKRSSSWGWATWKDRWEKVDWNVSTYGAFKSNSVLRKSFNQMGTDLCSMLDRQMAGKLDSWAIRWCFHQFEESSYTVYPTVSKVKNIGFDTAATHTVDFFNRFHTELDESGCQTFKLSAPGINHHFLKQFVKQYSIYARAKYKILNKFATLYNKIMH